MSKKSFINKMLKRVSDPVEPTAEEIDREVTAAVEAIKAEKLESLVGENVLFASDRPIGGKVYILDLKPIYELIGGSEGRLAERLRNDCRKFFAVHCAKGHDLAALEGELFIMRFVGKSEQEEFRRAATIVNAIGTGLLGNRFKTLDVPDLLLVASAAAVLNPDGTPNLDAMQATVKDGGIPVSMEQPGEDAPHWIKLRWKKEIQNFERRTQEFQAKSEAPRRPVRTPGERVKRKSGERRKRGMQFTGTDKRKAFDRRGRGY